MSNLTFTFTNLFLCLLSSQGYLSVFSSTCLNHSFLVLPLLLLLGVSLHDAASLTSKECDSPVSMYNPLKVPWYQLLPGLPHWGPTNTHVFALSHSEQLLQNLKVSPIICHVSCCLFNHGPFPIPIWSTITHLLKLRPRVIHCLLETKEALPPCYGVY